MQRSERQNEGQIILKRDPDGSAFARQNNLCANPQHQPRSSTAVTKARRYPQFRPRGDNPSHQGFDRAMSDQGNHGPLNLLGGISTISTTTQRNARSYSYVFRFHYRFRFLESKRK
jgi:hypothetical protein